MSARVVPKSLYLAIFVIREAPTVPHGLLFYVAENGRPVYFLPKRGPSEGMILGTYDALPRNFIIQQTHRVSIGQIEAGDCTFAMNAVNNIAGSQRSLWIDWEFPITMYFSFADQSKLNWNAFREPLKPLRELLPIARQRFFY